MRTIINLESPARATILQSKGWPGTKGPDFILVQYLFMTLQVEHLSTTLVTLHYSGLKEKCVKFLDVQQYLVYLPHV